jgi:hypothetical protein
VIKRISINGHDLSASLSEGTVVTQTDRARWRLTLQLDPDGGATGASDLLAQRIGDTVDVEVHEQRGTVLKGAAVISRFDPLTRCSELTGATRFTRERAPREPHPQ